MTHRSTASARRLAVATFLAALAACTTVPAPVQEVAEAEHAVQAAAATDAETLAPTEFNRARHKLEEARSALQAGQHLRARQLAEQAVVDAELAQITARMQETERAAAEIRVKMRDPGAPAAPRRVDS
jgi:hypothetical protein